MYVDSHVHLRAAPSAPETRGLIERALAAGVSGMLVVGGDRAMNGCALEAARLFPAHIRAAIGLDRDRAAEAGGADLDDLEAAIRASPLVAAVGEIGLDFHYSPESRTAQVALFRRQLAMAAALAKPVVVHSREANVATLDALREFAAAWAPADGRPPGVLHCFTGDASFLAPLLDLGFLISFSGILTFANAGALRDTARRVPDDRLLIETDTPYLAPVPYRGRRNEPAFVIEVARRLAAVRDVPLEQIARVTSANARRLLGLPAGG